MGDLKSLRNILWKERKKAIGEGVVRRTVICKEVDFFA